MHQGSFLSQIMHSCDCVLASDVSGSSIFDYTAKFLSLPSLLFRYLKQNNTMLTVKLHNRLRNILVKISYSARARAHTHTHTHARTHARTHTDIIVMTSHAHDYKNLISQQKMPLMVNRVPTLLHMTLNF